jgi:hypothetical protein
MAQSAEAMMHAAECVLCISNSSPTPSWESDCWYVHYSISIAVMCSTYLRYMRCRNSANSKPSHQDKATLTLQGVRMGL